MNRKGWTIFDIGLRMAFFGTAEEVEAELEYLRNKPRHPFPNAYAVEQRPSRELQAELDDLDLNMR